ncbi:hypothetical protein ACM41_16645 [Bradyrhizobium sp. CCBAU 21362]|uniref:hypothetical protein n=1 Tax=Bradyrhizobium sp. CCBAU 21362 TaxID=1325082 RepID=UPI0023062B08|nr:hypothetical protein [Bradyrhizobium sp. CCBAU 21362]MDA9537760.1 hypothetical protein [Bradyrhizobium sp. CCBAU 21362]
MRIYHFEDEWPKGRSIAHRLHDRVFDWLPPARQIDLDLSEEEHPTSDEPAKICVTLKDIVVFEYVLVTTIASLQSHVTKDDVVVVDIMRSNETGHFVSILDEVLMIFRRGEHKRENWRYFSAYPERVPEDCEISGYAKKENGKLLQFLFEKIEGQLK